MQFRSVKWNMMLKKLPFLFFSFLFAGYCEAQTYPQNYFRHPLDIPMKLVANFGEIRANHWHMGLDIRTQQKVNLPVYAAADGYVSRIVVEPGGFGQAIYIDHPNGYTTLYAHLNAFFPALADYVKKQQYAKQSWNIDIPIPANLFPVKKGSFIARSGSTGGSEGPHVHFEIRDTKTGKCLNPLLFNFPIADVVPPSIYKLAMYDRNKSTYEQTPQVISLKKAGSKYLLPSDRLRVGSNKISFAINAVDHFSGTLNPNGIYCAEIMMDDKPVSQFVLNNIGYDETRYINAQVDLPFKSRGGPTMQQVSPLPGAMNVAYDVFNGNGIIELKDREVHNIDIEVQDADKNTSTIHFSVQYDPTLTKPYTPTEAQELIPGQVNVVELDAFELYTTEATLYDSIHVNYEMVPNKELGAVSALHKFLSAGIPAHDMFTVRIKPDTDIAPELRDRVIIKNIAGSRTFVSKATWQSGWLSAKFRQFGSFQAFIDTTPPTVNAPPTNLSKASRLVFTPRDNFNTIKSFRAEVDGKWLCFSNDKGKTWIYQFDENFPPGAHELKLTIQDEAGNVMERTWNVRR
jgi:Peptidase family M23